MFGKSMVFYFILFYFSAAPKVSVQTKSGLTNIVVTPDVDVIVINIKEPTVGLVTYN